ncbi:MAG TPA: acetylornithine deacetylase [Pyrinomonadaceae bacterium]|jgi:acetylornithine deacetylase|nr:acetylornithine deacetylase [Pyrinomonadaceae bacterium]
MSNSINVEQTLAELVRFDSRSALSNREVINYASARCESLGLRARLLPYTDDAGVEKFNLVAVAPHSTKETDEIELALVGHTDTVPFDPAWREALTLTERGGKLYGRGACDTKGFIAAALAAVAATDLTKLVRPLALVFTADEEIGCLGAKQLSDARVMRVRNAVVGEPTSLQPMRAGKGYCLAEVLVRGREGHSAYPALGASAVMRAARLVTRIGEIAERLKTETHEAFDPPHTTLNVGIINGGTAKNIIAGECRFTLEWRPVPGQHPERVVRLIRNEIEELRAADAGFDCEINVIRLDGGIETPADSTLVRALEEATGRAAGSISFGTEAPQMAELGAHAVVFGPGDIRVAHRTGEFVPVEELHACVSILRGTIERFCAPEHQ